MPDCTLCRYSIPHFFTSKKTGKVTVGLHNKESSVTVENVPFNYCPECGKKLTEEKEREEQCNAPTANASSLL